MKGSNKRRISHIHSQQQQQQQHPRNSSTCLQQHTGNSRVGVTIVFFFLWGTFTSLLLLPTESYAFVAHRHILLHHVTHTLLYPPQRSSRGRSMSQQQWQKHSLRHRVLLSSSSKCKDDDGTSIESINVGIATQGHNGATGSEGGAHHLLHRHTGKNSHSNIEMNLAIKRTKQLQHENEQLKQTIQLLQNDNRRLQQQQQQQKISANDNTVTKRTVLKPPPSSINHPIVVLERFEGDNKLVKSSNHHIRYDDVENGSSNHNSNFIDGNDDDDDDNDQMWCDTPNVDDGTCPLEPNVEFVEALRDRAVWLVSLLIMQSISGIILYNNELVLSNHPSIIYFLTMLVGAGGNAGNQASVRVIRGIAIGALQPNNRKAQVQFLFREFKMAFALSIIVAIVGFLRTILFHSIAPLSEAIAITVALYMIVFTSICFGAILPFILQRLRIDPAHSSTSIQVIMDILGVYLTVAVTSLLLDSPFGKVFLTKFT